MMKILFARLLIQITSFTIILPTFSQILLHIIEFSKCWKGLGHFLSVIEGQSPVSAIEDGHDHSTIFSLCQSSAR